MEQNEDKNEAKNGEMTLETLATMIKGGFDEVNSKFDDVYSKFDEMHTEMLSIEKNIREDMQSLHPKGLSLEPIASTDFPLKNRGLHAGWRKAFPLPCSIFSRTRIQYRRIPT